MARDITEINDPRLIKALAHPIRIQVLRAIEGGHTTPSDIAKVIDEPLTNVSYHIRILARLEVIELAEVTHAGGALQHHYRTAGRISITDQAWAQVPVDVQNRVVADTLGQIISAAQTAANIHGFAREDAVLIRLTLSLDAQGLKEISAAAKNFLDTATDVEKRAAERLSVNSGITAGTETTVAVMHFTNGS